MVILYMKGILDMPNQKVLVVFYSRSGKTGLVAEELRQKFNADIEELVDTKNRNGILGYILAGKDAVQGKITEIKPVKYNPANYDLVIIGTPTWASSMSAAVRTYIEQNRTKLKKIALFATAAGEGMDKTIKSLEDLCKIKPEFTLGLSGKDMKNKRYVDVIGKLK
jgi:flavodoxin